MEDRNEQQQRLDRLYRRLTWRLMPLFCSCIMLNYLDRTSLAFASIQMTQELGFSPSVLGLGGGLFFISYCLMQLPSNIICMRVGVQRWLTCIMLAWGVVACLFAAVQHKWSFYLLRLLLGFAEAGSFPAVWYGVSLWFPPTRTSVAFALMNASVAVSQVVAAPVAAALLRLDGVGGLAGWKWVFLGEGLPSIAFALMLPCLLPDSPEHVSRTGRSRSMWMSAEELQLLKADRHAAGKPTATRPSVVDSDSSGSLAQLVPPQPVRDDSSTAAAAAAADFPHSTDHSGVNGSGQQPATAVQRKPGALNWPLLLRVVKVWQIWFLATTESIKGMAVMALMLWLPVMVQSLLSGGDPTQLVVTTAGHGSSSASSHHHQHHTNSNNTDSTGTLPVLLTAIPFTCAAVLTTTLGAVAQHTGQPLVYNFSMNLLGGTAFLVFPFVVHANRVAGFIMLTCALACGYASSPHPMSALTQITARALADHDADSSHLKPCDGGGSVPGDAQGNALGLPLYNTVAMLGGFFGPYALGVAVERLGGFSAGAIAMGVCMLAAGVAVMLLWCCHRPTRTAGAFASSSSGARGSGWLNTRRRHRTSASAASASLELQCHRSVVPRRSSPSSSSVGGGAKGVVLKGDAEQEQQLLLSREAVVVGDDDGSPWREGGAHIGGSPRVRLAAHHRHQSAV